MNNINIFLPLIIIFIILYGLHKKVDVYSSFIKGAKEGINTSISILPTIIAIILSISMFKASGGLDIIVNCLSYITNIFHIPKEVLPIGIIRPISASASTVLLENIFKEYGSDSLIGILASVINGSTETTFYTVAIYYSVIKAKATGKIISGCLISDITSFILSCAIVMFFY